VTNDCLFCAIVAREIPGDIVYEDDATLAFRDIAPVAPIHVLVVPKTHVRDIVELAEHPDLGAQLLAGIRATAASLGAGEFRTNFNTGASTGQTVLHVHAHILAGRPFGWPPG
jgi:histidine triad (HIT) family protein